MDELCGLIPAAGKGTRAYPYTKETPKSMLEINGVPNLERIIILMRDKLKITDIYIVIGYHGETIKKYFGNGSQLNVNLTYIQNNEIDRGLAYSILLGKEYIHTYFVVILSDECYVNSNHNELLSFPYKDFLATISLMEVENISLIKQNYSVNIQDDHVVDLIEKPDKLINNYLGCGTFIFSPKIFQYLDTAFRQSKNNFIEFITLIATLCHKGEAVGHFQLNGDYVNINDRDSLQLAKYFVRNKLMNKITTSLLICSEGNEQDITYTIEEYKKSEYIDNIYVLLPNKNSVEKRVAESGVKIIRCPSGIELYGEKIKYGLENIDGDIYAITEANYSFPFRDVNKLFAYIREADMVIGTRTTRQLIQLRSNMKGSVRISNILLAKLIELLWWNFECRFSDVGCTFRALWRSTFDKIRDNLNSKGPEFSVEMKIEILEARDRVIEIPINYSGKSFSLYEKYQNVNTFFRILHMIFKKRIRYFKNNSV